MQYLVQYQIIYQAIYQQTIMKSGGKLQRLGPNQQKVLLLLFGGVGLMLSQSIKTQFRVIKEVSKEWKNINNLSLRRAITTLYKSKLILEKENPDGTTTMFLTEKGKEKAITFNIETIKIMSPKRWDKKWRLVVFDIPEKKRKARDALREVLKKMEFYEYQKSIFIHPYHCRDELDYIIEFFRMRPYVRLIVSEELDNELHLRKIFNLS